MERNALAQIAPAAARRIREVVNERPALSRIVQFNSAAGLAAPMLYEDEGF